MEYKEEKKKLCHVEGTKDFSREQVEISHNDDSFDLFWGLVFLLRSFWRIVFKTRSLEMVSLFDPLKFKSSSREIEYNAEQRKRKHSD